MAGQRIDEDGHELVSYHKKDQKAIASVFFRFSHRDRENNSLTNGQQKKIVEDIYDNLLAYIKLAREQEKDVSSTYVMFYDLIKN